MTMTNNYSPPLSPRTTLSASTQNQQTIPTLPHDIIAAAHCLAPLDDLHLAHLVNELKPPTPVWSIYNDDPSSSGGPVIESNDRLRTDELADLPAPEAERLHAAYDIEDHLDCTPDRLLVYGPSTPLAELLRQVKELLIKNRSKSSATLNRNQNNQNQHHLGLSSSYGQSTNQVYVARVWFQPHEGTDGLYKWAKGGADLIRFEIANDLETSADIQSQPVIINWSPVEVALSQALEVGHQLLALLHSRQFTEILGTIEEESAEFRAINPIVWLVDPVEYAHAQLRETTEWAWSEHHVELNSSNPPRRACTSCPSSNSSASSTTTRDSSRRVSKSQLSHELCPLDHPDNQPQSPPSGSHPTAPPTSSSSVPLHSKLAAKSLSDDLPSWLDDLLDRRLPRLLSLPDGCLSHELLNSAHPVNILNNPQLSRLPPVPFTLSSPPSEQGGSGHEVASPALPSKMGSLRWPTLSAVGSPSRPFGIDQRSLANSVPSFDQHYIPSPGLAGSLRHGQTNTLRYYPCKACAEHAFKLALSHKLNEEKRRNHLPRSVPMRPSRSSQVHPHSHPHSHHHHHHHHHQQQHHHHRKGSRNGSTCHTEWPPIDQSAGGPSSSSPPPPPSASSSSAAPTSASCPSNLSPPSSHTFDCRQSLATIIDHHVLPPNPKSDSQLTLAIDNSSSSSSITAIDLNTNTNTNTHKNTDMNTNTNTNVNANTNASRIINHREPVIGLGVKGKALKEAMDREHDEFIKQHHHHLNHSLLRATTMEEECPARMDRFSGHTWDEGEAVED
ncbi:hypothetical protein PGT21_029046 [Puccinia graminis f. sp. tritici]|uniref:Uncharacterized protein n=1 Tax=Puccinia graminis f. sp. tritici TaxID=56615 RepID=A0A5B0R3I6_PUCGR|nr:hypothetical protein PGT21_029046 [Puccinia graminis f. sp. tritici]